MIHVIISDQETFIKGLLQELTKTAPLVLSYREADFVDRYFASINQSLWGESAPIIIRHLTEPFCKQKDIISSLSQTKKDVFIIVPEVTKWLDKLIKEAKIKAKFHYPQESSQARGAGFERWVNESLNSKRVVIRPAALRALIETFSSNPAQLLLEIEKLSAYRRDKLISNDELAELVRWPNESRLFSIINVFRDKQFGIFSLQLEREVNRMRGLDRELPAFLSLLMGTIFGMRWVKEADNKKQLATIPLKPFHKQMLLRGAHNFSALELERLYTKIAALERGYKSYNIKSTDFAQTLTVAISRLA